MFTFAKRTVFNTKTKCFHGMKKNGFWYRTFDLYYDGFRNMTIGKKLWAVILIKLFIMFAILKVFFFPNFLKEKAKGHEANFVGKELVKRGELPK